MTVLSCNTMFLSHYTVGTNHMLVQYHSVGVGVLSLCQLPKWRTMYCAYYTVEMLLLVLIDFYTFVLVIVFSLFLVQSSWLNWVLLLLLISIQQPWDSVDSALYSSHTGRCLVQETISGTRDGEVIVGSNDGFHESDNMFALTSAKVAWPSCRTIPVQ